MTTLPTHLKALSKPWKPHNYQKKSVKFLLEHAAGALFLDPGLGKTSITLGVLKILFKKKLIDKVLIVAPLRVCYSVWPAQIEQWKDFNKLSYTILHGPKKDENLQKDVQIYLINPEGLDWLIKPIKKKSPINNRITVTVDTRRFKKFQFDTLIIDELSKFKNHRSLRFKMLKPLLSSFRRRVGLTGTPVPNGLLDLFAQCYILDEGHTLGRYITHYRKKYFTQSYDGFNWDLQPGKEKEIYKKIKPLALRIDDSVLDMPTEIINDIPIILNSDVMDLYYRLEKELTIKIEDGSITAKNVAVNLGKCRQFISGNIYLDDEIIPLLKLPKKVRDVAYIHSAKADALVDLIDELNGNPLLVGYEFKHELETFKKLFGKNIPYIGGGVSAKESQKLEREWNKGKLPFLFAHPQSIAHGLNLQSTGYHICWYTLPFNYELYDQFNRRIRRQGNQSKRVFIHRLIVSDTVDDMVVNALKIKKTTQNNLFAALKTRLIKK